MAVHRATPHNWTDDELAVLAEVTERSWAHIERVRSSAHLKALNASLEDLVAKEVSARLRAEAQLHQAQKMEAIGQLTGGIAHDFNNMLSVAVGGLQLTRRRILQGRTDVVSYIDGAMEGAQRAAALTQRLLAFSRQQPLEPISLDPNKLVVTMTELLARTLGENVEVHTALASDVGFVRADPVQLESAILNLCVNARDAMPDGGRLTISTETSPAAVGSDGPRGHADSYVAMTVSDTGEGMSEEVMAKAFDPFFTTKQVGKGSGLGLSQVLGFIEQSGGKIEIQSKLGIGTSVRLLLPCALGEMPEIEHTSDTPIAIEAERAATILVVEDDDRVRAFSAEALTELGYAVIAVPSGMEAIKILEGPAHLDLLFTDMVMPGMTGLQIAAAAEKLRPELKVLYTTGYARDLASGEALGPVLQKPFALDALAKKVRNVLD